MSNTKLNRREFLKTVALGTAALPLLAACAPKATPTAAPVAKPAEEKKPPATAVPAPKERIELRWYQVIGPLDKQAEMYNERQDRVEVVHEVAPWGEHADKLLIDAAAGTAADCLFIGGPYWNGIKGKKVCLPISELLVRDNVDMSGFGFSPNKDWCSLEGKSYGLPTNGVILRGLAYNEGLFKDAGLDMPNDQWRWPEFIDAGKRIHNPPDAFGSRLANLAGDVWLGMIWSNGGSPLNEDETKCTLDSPEVIEVVQGVADWSLVHKFTMKPGEGDALGDQPTTSGKIATWHAIFTDWNTWMTQTKDLEVPAWQTTFPLPPNAKKRIWAGSVHMEAIWKDTKHPEEAWDFTLWRTTDPEPLEYQITLFQVNYDLKKTVDAVITDQKQRDFMGLGLKEYANAEGEYWGGGVHTTEILNTFNSEFDFVLLEKKTAAEAMKDATEVINVILES